MCGIAGIHIKPSSRGKLNAGQMMDWLLLGIEHRGKDATGFAAVSFDKQVTVDKCPQPAAEFVKTRKAIKGNPQTIIAHTRWATQGPAKDNVNNHPVQHGTIFVTHNGHISNDYSLFREYAWERHGKVDSEAIPAILGEMGGFENAGKALGELEGGMAIAALDVTQPGRLLLARGHSSPLVMIETTRFICWASTIGAIKLMWAKMFGTPPGDKRFRTLDEGTIVMIENGEQAESKFTPAVPIYGKTYTYGAYGTGTTLFPTRKGNGYSIVGGKVIESGGSRQNWWDDDDDFEYEGIVTDEVGDDFPPADELEVARTYSSWAAIEAPLMDDAMYELAHEMGMSLDLVHYLLFYADDRIEEDLPATVDYMRRRLDEISDKMLGEYTQTKSDKEFGSTLAAVMEDATSEEEVEAVVAGMTERRTSTDLIVVEKTTGGE